MANALFPKFKQALLDKLLDLNTDDIRVVLLNGYDFSTSHEFLSDVLGEAGTTEVARSGAALGSPTIVDGVFDAADVLFAGLTGSQVTDVVVFAQAGGADSARRVIAHFDTGTGIPFTPSGADWTLRWNASGIFAL